MMRIAQMLDTLHCGGAQRMQLFLLETLLPLGIDITVISLSDSSDSIITDRLAALGVRVVYFPFDQLFNPRVFLRLTRFLRAEKFDLLHTYLTYANIIGPAAGALSGTPVITSLRNADFEFKAYSRKREIIERFTMRYLCKVTMANGEVVGQFARQRLGEKANITVIPNAIEVLPPIPDLDRQALRSQVMGDSSRTMVLSVGRLVEQKGFPDLIEAFASIHSELPTTALVIAGEGDLQPQLEAQIKALGLQKDVFLLGRREDARQLMACADIYVNSSHWEGTPVTVLEAMASGLPVIATQVGENPYLLAEQAGLLVPARQPGELAAALRCLLESAQEREQLSKAALERVNTYYCRDMWRERLLALYAQTIPGAKPYLAAA